MAHGAGLGKGALGARLRSRTASGRMVLQPSLPGTVMRKRSTWDALTSVLRKGPRVRLRRGGTALPAAFVTDSDPSLLRRHFPSNFWDPLNNCKPVPNPASRFEPLPAEPLSVYPS